MGRSHCITDCEALFDTEKSVSSGRCMSDRRTGIDIQMINEKVKELNGVYRDGPAPINTIGRRPDEVAIAT